MRLSETMKELLLAQLQHEYRNALIYSYMASQCEYEGLTGCAKFFRKQACDEQAHANKVRDFIELRNEIAFVQSVTIPKMDDGFTACFANSLELERGTTEKLTALAKEAQDELDYMTFSFAVDLINEQAEEENLFQTIIDRIKVRGSDAAATHDIDVWIEEQYVND